MKISKFIFSLYSIMICMIFILVLLDFTGETLENKASNTILNELAIEPFQQIEVYVKNVFGQSFEF